MRLPTPLPLLFVATLAATSALAQQPRDANRPAYDGSASPDTPREIHIGQDCRILPGPTQLIPGKKDKPFSDSTICHLESVLNSQHMEEKIVGSQLYRSRVRIAEQEYVLQNIAVYPVVFVVEHAVSADWVIDSDPQPAAIENDIAVFPVHADPGRIVRLHVGLRHTQPLKTREIRN